MSSTLKRLLYLKTTNSHEIFTVRSFVFQTIREFLQGKKFTEVHLPSIATTSTDPVPDPTKELFQVKWYKENAFLIQSVQLHKQMLMAAGFSSIYSIAPFWRAEEIMTPRHLSESWSIDIEMADIHSEEDIMKVLEQMLSYVVSQTRNNFKKIKHLSDDIKTPFLRITYDNAITLLNTNNIKIDWGEDMGYEREKKLGKIIKKEKGTNIFFVTNFPAKVKKFYTKLKKDSKYTATFDLFWDGWEVTSGAQRETNLDTLMSRIKEKKLNMGDYQDFLDIFRFGAPEHGGCGVGLDRIVAKVLKLNTISEAVLFPRGPTQLHP